jgi:hypothetical protein
LQEDPVYEVGMIIFGKKVDVFRVANCGKVGLCY